VSQKISAQPGFEPKIVFLCPRCGKEVVVQPDRKRIIWSSGHGNCFSFTVERVLPEIAPNTPSVGPLVFIVLHSKISVREMVEDLTNLLATEKDPERLSKLDEEIRRLTSSLTLADQLFSDALEVIKSEIFGLKIAVGRGIYAYLWKWSGKYFGRAVGKLPSWISTEAVLATQSFDEAKFFAHYWLHFWEYHPSV